MLSKLDIRNILFNSGKGGGATLGVNTMVYPSNSFCCFAFSRLPLNLKPNLASATGSFKI